MFPTLRRSIPAAEAAGVMYRLSLHSIAKPPLVINQALSESWKESGDRETWMLTINEDEISTILPEEAESGESLTWKVALWGSHRDTKALQRLRKSFKTTLADVVKAKEWHFHQGIELRERPSPGRCGFLGRCTPHRVELAFTLGRCCVFAIG